jgi:hypothetical protein
MILSIETAHASWSDGKLSLSFDVIPENHSHLDLKTGEIFQDRGYATLRNQEDKQISATLFVAPRQQNAAGTELPSEMRYQSASGERVAEIWLTWRLADDQLTNLHSIILTGTIPRKAVIRFGVHNELEYGWEPDGSSQKWDNEKNRTIPLENVRFDFKLYDTRDSKASITEIPDRYDPDFFSDTGRVNFALLRKLSSLESRLERTNWLIGVIAVLILFFLLSRYWH